MIILSLLLLLVIWFVPLILIAFVAIFICQTIYLDITEKKD